MLGKKTLSGLRVRTLAPPVTLSATPGAPDHVRNTASAVIGRQEPRPDGASAENSMLKTYLKHMQEDLRAV